MATSGRNDSVLLPKTVIRRNQYSVGPMTVSHATTFVISSGNDYETEALAMSKLEQLNCEKKSIKIKAKQYLLLAIQRKASELRMTYTNSVGDTLPVCNHKDISLSWKQDYTVKNAQNMYELMYGQFETRSIYWRYELEKELMNDLNLEYRADATDSTSTQTGCISKLITAAKTEIIKNMNKIGKNEHGQSIGIANERGKGKKKKRRKMGEFMECFVRGTGSNTRKVIDLKVRSTVVFVRINIVLISF